MDSASGFVLVLTILAAVILVSERLRPDLVALLVMVILGLSGGYLTRTNIRRFRRLGGDDYLGNFHHLRKSAPDRGHVLAGNNHVSHIGAKRMAAYPDGHTIFRVSITIYEQHCCSRRIDACNNGSFKKSKVSPSRLMMPLAYGTLLGGMATLLTTSNIIVSGALREAGFIPFGLLDFLPIGIPIVLIGTVYLLIIGRRWLPGSPNQKSLGLENDLVFMYDLNREHRLSRFCPTPHLPINLLERRVGHNAPVQL